MLGTLPWVAVAANINLSHWQLAIVRFFLPSLPLIITPSFKRMLGGVFTITGPSNAGIESMTGAKTNKCFLASEFSLGFWYHAQQWTLVAAVGLFRAQFN